jgi:hypothetical protein
MMKKIFFIVLILFNVLTHQQILFSQNIADFDKGTLVVTVGAGFPDFYRFGLKADYIGYSSKKVRGFGPLIIKGDYGLIKFKWGHTLGAGALLGCNFTTADLNYFQENNNFYSQTDKYFTITFGVRGTYHFYAKEKFDCYGNVGLGFNINSSNRTSNDPFASSYSLYKRSAIYQALTVGIRYFFTETIGVYSEVGWDMSTPIQAGLSLKF